MQVGDRVNYKNVEKGPAFKGVDSELGLFSAFGPLGPHHKIPKRKYHNQVN